MIRFLGSLTIVVALAVWAGAEGGGSPAPPPAEQASLFHRDAELIDTLVVGAVDLTQHPAPLDKATRCRQMTESLAGELGRAADARDPARLAELADHLRSMVDEALVPTLRDARRLASVGSPEEKQLFDLRDQTEQAFRELEPRLRPAGRDGERLLESFREGRDKVRKAVEPPKD